jgi:hypothetical protein
MCFAIAILGLTALTLYAGAAFVLSHNPSQAGIALTFAGVVILAVPVLFGYILLFMPLILRNERMHARGDKRIPKLYPVGEERTFDGIYVSDMNGSRFVWKWDTGRSIDEHHPCCELDMPHEAAEKAASLLTGPTLSDEPMRVLMQFRGKVLERGSFGAGGKCQYRIAVSEFMEARRIGPYEEHLLRPSSEVDQFPRPVPRGTPGYGSDRSPMGEAG